MVDVKRTGSGFDALDLKLKELQGWEGRTGFFEDAAYPDGTKVAYVAAIQELGHAAGNLKPRPFFRPAIKENQKRWIAFAAGMARKILAGKSTGQDAMEAIADLAAEDVKQAIENVWWPKLKKKTLSARLSRGNTSNKPLIDTGLMIRSLEGKAVKE